MAKITYVKAAQQRYEQVPVIDPATGEQKMTPVMRYGKQRLTKTGKPIFLSVTQPDKSKPLPNRTCGKCREEIKVGDPYKHISPRSGPYGGRTLYRCQACPTWHVWEYSSSLSARLAEIGHNFDEALLSVEDVEGVQEALNEAAEAVREIATEKEESSQNIEDGFGHETEQSSELRDISEQLNSWADEIEVATIPDYPEPEEEECEECSGEGEVDNDEVQVTLEALISLEKTLHEYNHRLMILRTNFPVPTSEITTLTNLTLDAQGLPLGRIPALTLQVVALQAKLEELDARVTCEVCDGSGRVEPEEATADQVDEWRSECQSDLSIVNEPPV